MKAILDADILAYEFGNMKDLETEELLAWPIVRKFVDERIEEILQATEATSYKLYLTDSASNFRNKVATILPYKGHRPSDKPPHWEEIRQHLIDNYDAEVCYGIEADDRAGIEQMSMIRKHGVRMYLSNGGYTILDYEDYLSFKDKVWSQEQTGYVINSTGNTRKGERVYTKLHRAIMKPKDGEHIDHINGDKLDNRRCNLRVCSNKENSRNSERKSGNYKGITFDKERSKWLAQITVDGKNKYIGRFDEEVEAARAYDDEALSLFGEFAKLNLSTNHNVPEFEESIICSRDKDLHMVPGWHYSWECGKQKERKWFVNETDAIRFFYKQLLTGDATDNILGLYRVGEKASCVKALDAIDDECEMFKHVYSEYEARFGHWWFTFLLENAQLLWIMRDSDYNCEHSGGWDSVNGWWFESFQAKEIYDRLEPFYEQVKDEKDSKESSDEASVQDKSSEGQDKVQEREI